jgi:hypothetical protein
MAKGARSNHKKAVRTQRRLTLKASWQEEADARRYASLAGSIASESLPVIEYPVQEVEGAAPRGRVAKPAKAEGDAMETDVKGPAVKKKKGFKIKNGVQKKTHNSKKTSALWVSLGCHVCCGTCLSDMELALSAQPAMR